MVPRVVRGSGTFNPPLGMRLPAAPFPARKHPPGRPRGCKHHDNSNRMPGREEDYDMLTATDRARSRLEILEEKLQQAVEGCAKLQAEMLALHAATAGTIQFMQEI